MSPVCSVPHLQIYEEKRRRYLAAREHTSNSKPEHPTVRFRGQGESSELSSVQQNRHVAGKTNTPETTTEATSDRGEQVVVDSHNTATRQSRQMRPSDDVIREISASMPGSGVLGTSDQPAKHRYGEGSVDRDTAAVATATIKSLPASTRCLEDPKAEYARQLREQIAAKSAATQSANTNIRTQHPVVGSATSGSATRATVDNHRSIDYLARRNDGDMGNRDGAAVIDRKAEYGRQLREQMTEKASRLATTDKDRRTPPAATAIGSAREDAGQTGALDNHDPKAEYARQLREQMAETREARLVEGQRERDERFPFVDNSGLRWLVEADGRERHRRDAKAEYAEQLRVQMEVQKRGQLSGIEHAE